MKNDKKDNKISGYFKADAKVLAVVIIAGLIFNIGVVLPPIFQGKLLDSVIGGFSWQVIITNAVIFLGAVVIIQTARYFKRFYVRRFANNLSYKLRMIMYNNLVNMPIDVVEKQSESELMTKCVGDVEIFVEGTRKCLTETFDSGVLMISYFVSLLIYDPKTTLLATAFIPISFLIAYAFKKSIVRANIVARRQDAVANEYTRDLITNAVLYRNGDALNQKSAECEAVLQELKTKNVKASVFENAMQPIYMIICSLGVLFIIYFGVQNVSTGKFSVGDFTAYLTMFLALTVKSSRVGKLFNSFQKAKVSYDRIKERLSEEKPQIEASPNIGDAKLEVKGLNFEIDGKTVFKNV
ncbi:MAG: ABC transporter ATP-binding protein, partial [Clostridia bacterium]